VFQAADMIDDTSRCAVNEEVPFNNETVMMILPCLRMLVGIMN